MVDMVNHPPHYTVGGIETIDFIRAKLTPEEFVGYLKGSVIKYASRIGHKGDKAMDAGKLSWYAGCLASHVVTPPAVAVVAQPTAKRRGRPPGSKTKVAVKKRGRPAGSKNATKE